MADSYSFSTARKRRPRKIKIQSASVEETNDSPPSVTALAHDNSRSRSPQIEEAKSPVHSPASRSPQGNGNGNIFKAAAINSDVPPMMASSSSDSSSNGEYTSTTKGTLAERKNNIRNNGTRGKNTENGSGPDKIVKKMQSMSSEDSSSDSDDSDGGNKYSKYRKYLSTDKEKEKWSAPKKKLGAPPSLEFTYRYAESGPPPPPEEKKVEPPKPPKPVVPKSDKLSKADMATISFMLGAESDNESGSGSDSKSGSSKSGSSIGSKTRGLESIGASSADHQFVDGHSTDGEDDNNAANKSKKSSADEENSIESASLAASDQDSATQGLKPSSATGTASIGSNDMTSIDTDDELVLGYDDFSETREKPNDDFDSSESSHSEEDQTPTDTLVARAANRQKRILQQMPVSDSEDSSDSDNSSSAPEIRQASQGKAKDASNSPKSPKTKQTGPQNLNDGSDHGSVDSSGGSPLSRSEKANSKQKAPSLTVTNDANEDDEEEGLGEFLDGEKMSGNESLQLNAGGSVRSENNSHSEGDFSSIWGKSVTKEEELDVAKLKSVGAYDASPISPSERSSFKGKKLPPMPPTVHEDDEGGSYQGNDEHDAEKTKPASYKSRASSMRSSSSSSSSNEDYSDIWAQSVREEAGHDSNRRSSRGGSTSSEESELSKKSHGSNSTGSESEKQSDSRATVKVTNRLGNSSSSSESSIHFVGGVSERSNNSSFGSPKDKKADKLQSAQAKEKEKLMSQQAGKNGASNKKKNEPKDDSFKLDASLKLDGSGSISAFDLGGSARKDDNNSISGFSLQASQELLGLADESDFDRPEYEPKRKKGDKEGSFNMDDFNQGLQNIDVSGMDLEASNSTKEDQSKEKPQKEKVKIDRPTDTENRFRYFARGSCFIILASAIFLPIYFCLFNGDDVTPENLPDIGDLFPPELTTSPTPSPPTATPTKLVTRPPVGPPPTIPVTRAPTAEPTPLFPTAAPTISTISELRQFLIGIWPSLEDDFIGFTSPQFRALDWLANNANIDTYSENQIVQRFALATLYFSTLGETWRRNDLWLSDEDECTWYTSSTRPPCDSEGLYMNLELDLNSLAGTIPSELALLSNGLTRIDFSRAVSRSFLSGSIPSELGLLTELTFVNLRGNRLAGAIPSELGSWRNIFFLDLSDNMLSNTLPTTLGGMTELEALYLQGNQLSGLLVSEIGLLTQLSSLDIAYNNLIGPLPSELGNIQLLETLNLEENRLTSLTSELGQLILLRSLSIFNNNLVGSIPSEVGNMNNLLSLDLSGNNLSGTIPTQIGNLFIIRDSLNLSKNRLGGPIPSEMGRLIFLRNLLLYDNLLTGGVPNAFISLVRLSSLRIEGNNLTGTVPVGVCSVFENTFPIFAADCTTELDCPCCMFCCEDGGDCQCQFEFTEYDFLCVEYTQSPGLTEKMADFISY